MQIFGLVSFFASDFVENSTSFYFFIVVKKIVVFFTIRFIACSKHLYNLLEFFILFLNSCLLCVPQEALEASVRRANCTLMVKGSR